MPKRARPAKAIVESLSGTDAANRVNPSIEIEVKTKIENLIPYLSIKRPAGMHIRILGKE